MTVSHPPDHVLAVKTFPRSLYAAQLVVAGIFVFALVAGTTSGSAILLDFVLLVPVITWLVISPIKAKTIVYEDSIEVRTIFGVKTATRKKVRYFRGGLLGPVVVLVDGTKIQAIAPVPKDCWVERRPIPYNPPH